MTVMKKYLLSLLFVSMALIVSGCSLLPGGGTSLPPNDGSGNTKTGNLINNPGFENGTEGWSNPYVPSGEADSSVVTNIFRSGEASMQLKTETASSRIFVNMTPRLSVEPGEIYRLSGWIKTSLENESGSAHFRAQFKGSDGANIAQGHLIYSGRVRGDNDWTFIELMITIPDQTAYLAVELSLENSEGTVWWDDLELYYVDPFDVNLLGNGDFRDGLNSWKVHQFDDDNEALVTVDEGVLSIESTTGDERVSVHQTITGVQEDETFHLSFQINTNGQLGTPKGASSSARTRIQVRDGDGTQIGSAIWTDKITQTDGWQSVSMEFTLPTGARRVQLEIFSEYVIGTVSFKDVAIKRVP